MPKFAIYYIPKAGDRFYRLATEILGYDVRRRKLVKMSKKLKDRFYRFGEESEDWVKDSRPYGFHLTIGETIDFNFRDILSIENEIKDILNCFNPDNPFILRCHKEDFVAFWPVQNGHVVVLRYDPNDYLKMFHTIIAARVHTLGVGSLYLRSYFNDPGQYKKKHYQAYRIQKFYSPTVFDSYSPHFTLLNPYTGKDQVKLSRLFMQLFGKFPEIRVDSICLLLQMSEDENWQIYREFKRKSYPEPLNI